MEIAKKWEIGRIYQTKTGEITFFIYKKTKDHYIGITLKDTILEERAGKECYIHKIFNPNDYWLIK